jgi:superfamily II DNA or RNA helicase
LLELATGLGKTVIFSKIIQRWKGRVLVIVDREELLQQGYHEISGITGEIIGIERSYERQLGERVVVATIQTLSLRLETFSNGHFSLIIIDECHCAASRQYLQVLEYFSSAKVIGLTATAFRSDGQKLPFETCSYRMGIREGIEQGYLVPIRGKRIVVDQINLTRVKKTESGDFDETSLDDEMVKGAHAIADVIANDYPFDKGILFFPGCISARFTSELINKRLEDTSIYVDGKIIGKPRRNLIDRLHNGKANWLCNVGVAIQGFNWPEASVIGMCVPTLSKSAYVQRAGRGTRPIQGLLNSLPNAGTRLEAIGKSQKPYMTILDFVGISANLNLIGHESFLDGSIENEKEERTREKREESPGEDSESVEDGEDILSERSRGIDLGLSRIASGIQSKTIHSSEDFDPFEATHEEAPKVKLKETHLPTDTLSEKQYNLIKRNGIDDDKLTRKQAQELVKFIAGQGFRLGQVERSILKKLYTQVKNDFT